VSLEEVVAHGEFVHLVCAESLFDDVLGAAIAFTGLARDVDTLEVRVEHGGVAMEPE
jgi:hypothetical protein